MKKQGRKSKLEIERSESQKYKNISMKDISTGTAVQKCLDCYSVKDVLPLLKKVGARINKCEVNYRYMPTKVKVEVPKILSQLGKIYHRIRNDEVSIDVVLFEKSVKEATEILLKVAEHYNVSFEKFNVKEMQVERDGVIIRFKYLLKDLYLNGDKRVKTKVLAAIKYNSKEANLDKANRFLDSFSLSNYVCKLHTEEKRIAICSKQ